jgi:hypothetical protein
MIDLLTLPMNILKLSPFTACKIATPTVALISACKTILHGDDLARARERIRVAIAAVEKLGEVWPRAAKTAKDLKTIAREVFGLKTPAMSYTPCISVTMEPYSQASNATSYQEFSFLDDLIANDQCEFSSSFGYDTVPALALPSGNVSGDSSNGIVSIAY